MRLPLNIENNESLAHALVSATLGSAGVHIAGMAVTFLVGVQLARYLGAEGYGVFGIVMAVVALLAVVAQVGLPQLLTRELASHAVPATDAQGSAHVKGALVWFATIVAGASAVIVALGWLGMRLWPSAAGGAFAAALFWGLVNVPLLALLNLGVAAVRGYHRVIAAQFYGSLLRPMLFAMFLLVAAGTAAVNPANAIAVQAFAGLVALLVCAFHVWRITPLRVREAVPKHRMGFWIGSAAPLTGTEILRVLEGHYAVLLLSTLAALDEVGSFRVAVAVGGFVGLPSTLVNVVVMPYIASLHSAGDHLRLQSVAAGGALMMFASTLSITVGIYLFGEPLLTAVFGTEFSAAWAPLALMGIAYTINGYFGSAATMLNMCGQERTVVLAHCVGLSIGVVITVALYGALGVTAAAVAMIGTEAAKGAWMARVAYRRLSVDVTILGSGRLFSALRPSVPRAGSGRR